MALKIQVTGRGIIPRGLGLAPRLTPFPADKTLCATILSAGFGIKFMHPETGNMLDLTKKNINRMFELHDGKTVVATTTVKEEVKPATENKVETPVVAAVKVEEKVPEVKTEVAKEESTMTPVTKTENTQKNNNQNNNQKNNNNQNNNQKK